LEIDTCLIREIGNMPRMCILVCKNCPIQRIYNLPVLCQSIYGNCNSLIEHVRGSHRVVIDNCKWIDGRYENDFIKIQRFVRKYLLYTKYKKLIYNRQFCAIFYAPDAAGGFMYKARITKQISNLQIIQHA
jgi:hypothetical protein